VAFATLYTPAGLQLAVLSLRLVLPLRGAWYCTAELDATDDETPVAGARVRLEMAGREWSGYVVRSQPWAGRARLRVEAGAGGMRASVPALAYQSALLATIAAQAVADAGELLAADAFASLDVVAQHHRAAGPAGVALTTALASGSYAWRFNDAGEVWWGAESWPAASDAGVLELEPFGDDGSTRVAPLAPTLSPGQVWAGRPVERVVYELGSDGLEAELVFSRSSTPSGDLRGLFERAVRAQIRELPYLAHYPASVVRQTVAGLELQPDSSAMAGTPPLAPRYGLPGVRCEVPAGSRVGVAFEAGSAREGRAVGWEEGTAADMIEIEAGELRLGEGASLGVVRTTDLGDAGTFAAGLGPVSLVYTGPDGSAWSLTLAAGATPVTAVIAPLTPTTTAGKLVTRAVGCSAKVKAT